MTMNRVRFGAWKRKRIVGKTLACCDKMIKIFLRVSEFVNDFSFLFSNSNTALLVVFSVALNDFYSRFLQITRISQSQIHKNPDVFWYHHITCI